MILVTVGMQLGFDRLIEAMDKIAPMLSMPVLAQTGKGTYQPRNLQVSERIAPEEFEQLVRSSKAIISHAGIGTILTAQRFSKPIVLFPRRAEFGEHRNDHQVATVRNLDGRKGLLVALEEADLVPCIKEALAMESVTAARSGTAQQLHHAVTSFIETGEV